MGDRQKNTEAVIAALEPFGEIGIDLLIKEELLKDFPILGTIFSFVRLKNTISDSLLSHKIKLFIENITEVSEDAKENFNKKMASPDEASRIKRLLLHHINTHNSEEKSELLGFILSYFVRGEMTEKTFKRFASLIGLIDLEVLRDFVIKDGKFDWLHAHDYIAHGLAIFEVPPPENSDGWGAHPDTDQTGMAYGANPWGAEVISVLKPYYAKD